MRSQYFLLLLLVVSISSCKKRSSSDDPIEKKVVDTTLDDTMSVEQAISVSTIPQADIDSKHIILSNGQSLYSYLLANSPSLLSINTNKKIIETGQRTDVRTNSVEKVRTDDEERLHLIALMLGKANQLADKVKYADIIKRLNGSQPLGLAYVYNGKDPNIAMVGAPNDKGIPSKCREALYGLDCSGFVSQSLAAAGIEFKARASVLATPSQWKKVFDKLGYSNLEMKEFKPKSLQQSDLINGDIIYWGQSEHAYHIGLVFKDSRGDLYVFASNGSPNNDCNTNKLGGPSKILLSKQIEKMNDQWGILRMTIPQEKLEFTKTVQLSVARRDYAVAGALGKVVFAGGYTGVNGNLGIYLDVVDIYDVESDSWTTAKLSVPRAKLAATALGDKIYFAGGTNNNGLSKRVDIYNITTGKWSTEELFETLGFITAAAAGNKVLFAGGNIVPSNMLKAELFDVTTNKWSVAPLQKNGANMVATSVGDKILVAAGDVSEYTTMDRTLNIYDVLTEKWSTKEMNVGRSYFASGSAQNIALIAGSKSSKVVDVFDAVSGTLTTTQLSEARNYLGGVGVGSKIVFAGGYSELLENTDIVDIYDIHNKTWSTLKLSENRTELKGAAVNKKVLFGGGLTYKAGIGTRIVSTVDIFTLKPAAK